MCDRCDICVDRAVSVSSMINSTDLLLLLLLLKSIMVSYMLIDIYIYILFVFSQFAVKYVNFVKIPRMSLLYIFFPVIVFFFFCFY